MTVYCKPIPRLCVSVQYPKMQALRDSYIFSINQEYAKPGERHDLHVGDEIAFITPLSGG